MNDSVAPGGYPAAPDPSPSAPGGSPAAPDPYRLAREAASVIAQASSVPAHDIALVLGSGWSGAADLLGETVWSANASTVPGFHPPSVPGHAGTLRSTRVEGSGARALVLGARTHLYEGRGAAAVVHGIRTAAAAGCRTVVLTNGCGGIDESWSPGQPVLINDQVNFTGDTPLAGANFVDLTDLYTPRLRQLAHEVDPSLPEGVYMQFRGPSYETPAEIRMARTVGATLVGMSTALEAIAAREAGMDVLGISLITNLAAGISPQALSHQEVLDAGRDAGGRISQLLAEVVRRITEAAPEPSPDPAADMEAPAPATLPTASDMEAPAPREKDQ